MKSMSSHQYPWNSEVETTWISLIGWHHKTSSMYGSFLQTWSMAQTSHAPGFCWNQFRKCNFNFLFSILYKVSHLSSKYLVLEPCYSCTEKNKINSNKHWTYVRSTIGGLDKILSINCLHVIQPFASSYKKQDQRYSMACNN